MTLARACSVLGLLVLAALLAGCTSQDGGTPSPTASPTASVFVLDHATPSSTATREPVVETVELTHTAWLIDLASGDVHTIHEDPDAVIWRAEWSGDTARIYSNLASEGVAFTRDGDEAEVAPVPHACEQVDDHVVIDGVEYPEIGHCYLFSPSGRYVPYSVDADEYQDPRGLTLPRWDQWILDLETGGRTMVQAGLVHCGGCDAMFGMSWSPDERYLVVADLAAEERVFLVDLERGTSRVVAHGGQHHERPAWSPNVPGRLLVRSEDGDALLIDDAAGTEEVLPLAWPARFDVSGRYAYSPSGLVPDRRSSDRMPDDRPRTTTVYDIDAREVVAEIEGIPVWSLWSWSDVAAVVATETGFVAAVDGRACRGTVLYTTGDPERCLEGAYHAVPSPDGTQLAVSIPRGPVAMVNGGSMVRYDIGLYDIATDTTRVVAEGALSGGAPPRLRWNDTADALLVAWPTYEGV